MTEWGSLTCHVHVNASGPSALASDEENNTVLMIWENGKQVINCHKGETSCASSVARESGKAG